MHHEGVTDNPAPTTVRARLTAAGLSDERIEQFVFLTNNSEQTPTYRPAFMPWASPPLVRTVIHVRDHCEADRAPSRALRGARHGTPPRATITWTSRILTIVSTA